MTKTTTITRKAKDGKLFSSVISEIGLGSKEWCINFDNDFTWNTRKECEKAARNQLKNIVEDYEYDNELR